MNWFPRWIERGGVTPFNLAPSFHPNVYFMDAGGDPGGGGGGDPPADPPADPPSGEDAKQFSQADVNRMMAKESTKHKAEMTKTLDQLKTLKDSKGQSDEQRADLANRIREIEEGLMTEKDRSKAERDRLEKAHAAELQKEKNRGDVNWGRYVETRKRNEIAGAAMKHKAYRTEQLSAIVAPLAKVVAIKNSDGDETGEFKVMIPARVKKENSDEMIDKELSVDEHVAAMKENPDFANLFVSDKPGGTGFHPGSGKPGEPAGVNLTPAQKVTVGLRQMGR